MNCTCEVCGRDYKYDDPPGQGYDRRICGPYCDGVKAGRRQANKWMSPVCDNLPPGWEIDIEMFHGEASIKLFDPDGNEVEVCEGWVSVNEMLMERVNEARMREGLQPI